MITNAEINVLDATTKNSKRAQSAIATVLNKVYDEELAYDLSRQAQGYRQIERKAKKRLLEEGVLPKDEGRVEKLRQWSSLQAGTLLDTSTGHVADLMIQGKTKNITGLMKAVHHNGSAGSFANEIANELMDFEEHNIAKLKGYKKEWRK